jgi:hypothetical protein
MKNMFIKFRESLAYDAFAGIGIGYWTHEVFSYLLGLVGVSF